MISVNGIVIDEARLQAEAARHSAMEDPLHSAGRELVLRELLRQRADSLGLTGSAAGGDPEASVQAGVQAVLAAEVKTPEADEAACRRYYAQNQERFRVGERVEASHILFQITPRVDPQRLRAHAGDILQQLHAAGAEHFGEFASRYSNCPSARDGGRLGEIGRGDTVPEFEQAVFAMPPHQLGERLIHSRHGFHIVLTGRRNDGLLQPFETVQERIAAWLQEASRRRATAQYLQWLVGQARIEGIEIQGADSPLVQ